MTTSDAAASDASQRLLGVVRSPDVDSMQLVRGLWLLRNRPKLYIVWDPNTRSGLLGNLARFMWQWLTESKQRS